MHEETSTEAEAPRYRGPYVLMRDTSGELVFVPAKQEHGQWVPLTKPEIEEQVR